MADDKKPDAGGDRQKLMAILVPAGGAAVVIILVAVILALSDSSTNPSDKGKGKGGGGGGSGGSPEATPTTVRTDLTKLSDGTDPTAEDANLKDGPGGLRMRDLKVGDGDTVPAGAMVKVHYTGWLTDGTRFDSSVAKNEPIAFSLDPSHPELSVIAGWQKGIPGMKVGGVRKLVIPADLAYGPRGRPGIPGGATLIFEVEMLGIK